MHEDAEEFLRSNRAVKYLIIKDWLEAHDQRYWKMVKTEGEGEAHSRR